MEKSRTAAWLDKQILNQETSLFTQWNAAQNTVAISSDSTRARILLTGSDRIAFLQGICSNNLELLPIGNTCEAVFLSPKGKMIADARLIKLDDAVLIDVESSCLANLCAFFEKYRVHEECQWRDASLDLEQIRIWGPLAATLLNHPVENGVGGAVTIAGGAYLMVGIPFGASLFLAVEDAESVMEELMEQAFALKGHLISESLSRAIEVSVGLGRYGIDWDESINPLEAGLDRAIDYQKGCYVGQEVVAKATYIGRVNKRLVRLFVSGSVDVNAVLLEGETVSGRITACVKNEGEEGYCALGYVRRTAAVVVTVFQIQGSTEHAKMLGFPYLSKEKPLDK